MTSFPVADRLRITVTPDTPVIEAIKVLNSGHKRIILIAEADDNLLGVITDSDVRQAVLQQKNLQQPISTLMVKNPICVGPDATDTEILSVMEQTQCYQIPVVGEGGKIFDVRFVDELLRNQQPELVNTAIVMAGGVGSRLLPLTEKTPKPLIEVGGRPILFSILDRLISTGFIRIFVTLNYRGEQIRSAVEKEPSYSKVVEFIEETEPLGTAGALNLLPETVNKPILVMNGDLLTNAALDELRMFHGRERNVMTVALKDKYVEVPYGIAEMDGTRIIGMQEKPKLPFFVNAGVYMIEPIVFKRIPPAKHWDMTDVIDDLLAAKLRVGGFPIHEYWIDIGEIDQLDQARKEMAGHE